MSQSISADEAAAVVAAVERFRADTAAPASGDDLVTSPWQRAALVEGVSAKRVAKDLEGGVRWLS
jgi:hypothetical protein